MALKTTITKDSGLESNIIQGFLKLKGISQLDIARKGDVSEQCVSQVILRETTSRQVRTIIADELGLPYEFVWGKETRKAA